jgi:predicted HTH transcriptional regulator
MLPWLDLSPLDDERLRSLLEAGESEHLEFKVSLPPEREIARQLVALANSGGGTLLIGVSDEGGAYLLSTVEARRAVNILRALATSIVSWGAGVGHLERNARYVVYVTVPPPPEAEIPVTTADGEAYIRQGDRLVRTAPIKPAAPLLVAAETPVRLSGLVAMSFRDEGARTR